jgi:hypothetical protein
MLNQSWSEAVRSWKVRRKRDHSDDHGVGGKVGSKWILRRLAWGCVDWIRLAQDRDWWRDVESAEMNLRVLGPRSYLE